MLCSNLSFNGENKGNFYKIRLWPHFRPNMMNEIFSFLKFLVFIDENDSRKMNFPLKKNGILIPLGIMRIPQNVWP